MPSPGAAPTAVFPEERFEFGEVMSGTVVEHDFVVKNHGSVPLLIQKVRMTPPLLLTQMPRQVAAGAEGRIHLKLDSANLAGKFEGTIWVVSDDPAKPGGSNRRGQGRSVDCAFPDAGFLCRRTKGRGRTGSDRDRKSRA